VSCLELDIVRTPPRHSGWDAGIPRTYRQKDWWHQGTPGSRRR